MEVTKVRELMNSFPTVFQRVTIYPEVWREFENTTKVVLYSLCLQWTVFGKNKCYIMNNADVVDGFGYDIDEIETALGELVEDGWIVFRGILGGHNSYSVAVLPDALGEKLVQAEKHTRGANEVEV